MASWDIFRELDSMRREMDAMFRGAGTGRPFGFPSPAAMRAFPMVNVSEDSDNYYVQVLLPGVDPKAVDVSVIRNALSISGERKPVAEQRDQVVHRSELDFGKFSRTVELPVDLNPDSINAQYKDGVLVMTMAKAEHMKPKRVEISVT